MKKVKTVNGFSILELNQKEQQEHGYRFAVIASELYTGNLNLDMGCFDYDQIDSLGEAVEKATAL